MNSNLVQNTNGNNPFEIFNYKNLGQVRCYIDQVGTKWFCQNDVCTILGINNSRQATTRLLPDGVISNDVIDSLGRVQQATFINEGNLMELIFSSRKDEAKEFRSWVCHEVLPQLSSKGYYSMNRPMSMPEIVEQIAYNVQNINNRLVDLEAWQSEVKQILEVYGLTGHVSVRGYAIMNSIPINNNQAKYLGGEATKLAQSRGLEIKSIPDPRYGVVNGYPKIILDEVFSTVLPQLKQS